MSKLSTTMKMVSGSTTYNVAFYTTTAEASVYGTYGKAEVGGTTCYYGLGTGADAAHGSDVATPLKVVKNNTTYYMLTAGHPNTVRVSVKRLEGNYECYMDWTDGSGVLHDGANSSNNLAKNGWTRRDIEYGSSIVFHLKSSDNNNTWYATYSGTPTTDNNRLGRWRANTVFTISNITTDKTYYVNYYDLSEGGGGDGD